MKWICQICHIVRSVRESDLWSVRPWWEAVRVRSVRPWESVRGCVGVRSASHAQRAMQSDPQGRLTDFTAKRIALPGVHERPIGLPHGLSLRTLRQITWLWVRSASHAQRAMQSDPRGRLTDFTAKRIASPGVRERLIGLTDLRVRWGSLIGSDRSHEKFCEAETMRGRVRPNLRDFQGYLWGRERPWEAVLLSLA